MTPTATLPPGLVSKDQLSTFFHLRRQEIVSAARTAFDERASAFTDEELFRHFFTEGPENYLTVLPVKP